MLSKKLDKGPLFSFCRLVWLISDADETFTAFINLRISDPMSLSIACNDSTEKSISVVLRVALDNNFDNEQKAMRMLSGFITTEIQTCSLLQRPNRTPSIQPVKCPSFLTDSIPQTDSFRE